MSMMDAIDDALLGADDLDYDDYDLEKDEEDALLADDNYEEGYDETQGDEHQDQQFEEPVQEEESDILDIDSNINLDEEDFGDQTIKEEITNETETSVREEIEDDEEVEEQKERNRFLNERSNTTIQRTNSHVIPDNLDKVAVQPVQQQLHNNQRNGRFQRGNRGRGRGRQNNHNRGSVFGRVGNLPLPPPLEGKTVLINPHFRGNVQVSENARLVWDSNYQNQNYPQHQQQQRYQGPQMAQVAPFQSQPSPWINPPYAEQNNNFNHPPIQPNYQEPPPSIQYNQHQPPETMNPGIRSLMQINNHNQPPPFVAQQPPPQQQMTNWCDDQSYCENMYPPQGNFRGRDVRFTNQTVIAPPLINNPPPNFNQQLQQQNFQGRNNFFPENQNMANQNRPFINQNIQNTPPPIVQVQPNYPPQQQNYDQPPQQFIQHNQFNQNRHNIPPPPYDQYSDHNQYQNQNFQGQNFQQPAIYDPNFIPHQPAPESFPPKQYNHNYQNRQNSQHQRHQVNTYNRSPPKRRSFENSAGPERDLPKKKKRSMELSNLHQVPTVDTTSEEKEEEDEETKAYRLKIEEQKKLREKILREKEERRKLAAAQKESDNSSALLTTLKTRTVVPTTGQAQQQQQKPIAKQPQQIQTVKLPNQQWRSQQQQPQQHLLQPQQQLQPQQLQPQQLQSQQQQQQQHVQNPINRNPQQQRQRQMMQQRKQNNQQRSQNIQVQAAGQRTNQVRVGQPRRIQQQNQANIVITQKNEQQQQRVVMLKQNANASKTVANRRVVLKGMNTVNETSGEISNQESPNVNLSSFLSNRKVISNSAAQTTGVGLNQAALLETPVVVVSNLAAGTTDVKIRKLCQGLGPIQNIQMIPNARQATIRFKNIVSAHKFFKKYQRKIIDLSMIQVSLEPESKA